MLKIIRISNVCARLSIFHQQRSMATDNRTLNECRLLTRAVFTLRVPRRFLVANSGIEDEESVTVDDDTLKNISKGDLELEKKLRVIALEAEVLRQGGGAIPSGKFFKPQHWEELLKLETRTARRKYLAFLFKIQKTKESQQFKKEVRRLEREKIMSEKSNNEKEDENEYTLWKNCILPRIRDTTINQLYNNKLVQAMQFGQKLIMDCGYDANMTTRENVNCAKQLTLAFAENRVHDEPFDIHFCNINKESSLHKSLLKNIPTLYDDAFPINTHTKSYLDIFPKEQLVYLTPHCREEMGTYDHDAIYIIGGIVDKINNEPLSLAKAKKEGLKMFKLPLDRYLHWGAGSGKSLTLNQMIAVLLDIKRTGDWAYALRHVPKRKLNRDENLGVAIRNFNSLRYDSEDYKIKGRQGKVPLMEVKSKNDRWTPKPRNKEKLINVGRILKS